MTPLRERSRLTARPERRRFHPTVPQWDRNPLKESSMSNVLPTILSIGEAARYSGLHRDRIVLAMNRRQMRSVIFEGRRFIRPNDLVAWLDSQGLPLMPIAGGQS
jgi:hypothetical protein